MRQLLLLHGFTGAPSSFDAVVRELPSEVHVVAPYLMGHGRPPAALEVTSFEAEVDRLANCLGPGEWEVAGYSLGARVALGLLVRHRQRFVRGVLLSGRPGLASTEERAARVDADEELARELEREGLAAFLDRWQNLPLFASQRSLPAELRRDERRRREGHAAAGLAHSLRVTGLGRMPNYWDELGSLNMPVDVLAGGLDSTFCALAEAVVGKLPKARFSCIANAGHNLLLERPADVARAIARGPFA